MINYTQKKYFILVICFCIYLKTNATNYYFSSSLGNDANTTSQAQNPLTPWKTITKLNAIINTLLPGDSVLFKSGDTFYGYFSINVSGNSNAQITFSSYGQGNKPIISGLSAITNWISVAPNLWEANCSACGNDLNVVLINDTIKGMGRYPNNDAANKGYLSFETHLGSTQITDNQLTSSPTWNGAEAVVRTNRWLLEKRIIQSHVGSTITFSAPLSYTPFDNWGYFIQNHPATLDKNGEWYFNPTTKKISLYSNNNINTSAIKVATINAALIYIGNQNNITINNIQFAGGNYYGILINNVSNLKITHCDFRFIGIDGIIGGPMNQIEIKQNNFEYCNNDGINISKTSNALISNNSLNNIGLIRGAAQSGGNSSNAIAIGNLLSKNNKIEYNTIDSVGYMGITIIGDSTEVNNNYIKNFTIIKDDGGGIYGSVANSYANRVKIHNNIIINGIGAIDGTYGDAVSTSFGIYADDQAKNTEINGNTIANCLAGGIILHNAHEIDIRNNTLFNNNYSQLYMSGHILGDSIRNNNFYNNILFAKKPQQLISNLYSNANYNDIKKFASFDSNYYCRPTNENFVINDMGREGPFSLAQWQTSYANDLNSNITPLQLPTYTVNNLIGTNKFTNGSFNSNISGINCYTPLNNCVTSWDNTPILDGGSLAFSFSSATSPLNKAGLYLGVGTIDSTKKYILKFSLKGTKNNQSINFYLRKTTGPPYIFLSQTNYCQLTTNRTENEFLLEPNISSAASSLIFEIEERDSTFWIDNIELREANVTMTDQDDYIRFEYNATQSPKTIPLSDQYIDVKNNFYSNSLTLQPFTSVILLKVPNTVGIKNNIVDQKSNITIYPNPTSNQLNFQSTNKDLSKILIYDLIGRCILEQTYSSQIDVSGLTNGVYIIKITNKNEQLVGSNKIIVQK